MSATADSRGQKVPAHGDPKALAYGWVAGVLGLAGVAYGACVAKAWYSYGRPAAPGPGEADSLLDNVMPDYEVTERHSVCVLAPPDVTLSAACAADLQQSPLVRGIFAARERLLGARPESRAPRAPLLAQMKSIGWRVLAESPGREIVMGAVTQPWMANVVFRGLSAEEFRWFHEPGFVKIAWTLRVESKGPSASILRTETRVTTTDGEARRRFRWYWARFSPGIVLIRYALLRRAKRDAERRARSARAHDGLSYEWRLDS